MGAILEEKMNEKRQELMPTEDQIKAAAREAMVQEAASADQRVGDIQSNLDSAKARRDAVHAELAELDAPADQPQG